jgi:hypothetical protein
VLHQHGQEGVNLIRVGAALTPLDLVFPSAKDDTDACASRVNLHIAKVGYGKSRWISRVCLPKSIDRRVMSNATPVGVAVRLPNFQCRTTGYSVGAGAATNGVVNTASAATFAC